MAVWRNIFRTVFPFFGPWLRCGAEVFIGGENSEPPPFGVAVVRVKAFWGYDILWLDAVPRKAGRARE